MRIVWTLVRALIALAAVGILLVTPVFVTGPNGTSIEPAGALIDAIALVVLVGVLWSLWRDRSRLF